MAEEDARVGSVIASKYRLDEELGRGGMGAVYRAFHLRVHKVFALKMLLGEAARHRSVASRFLLEAQAAGRIGHPGILDVYDVGEDADGTPFIVMELLRGEALSTLLRRERIDVDAAVWIAMEVLGILEAAHKAGIIHRDVKPQNVFVTEKGGGPDPGGGERGVKLLDFGIAKFSGVAADGSVLTRSGEIIGSPLYMAPEQAKGEPDLDERADVWSVGAMLFEMLTGTCAHAATSPVAVLSKILTEPAPPPSSKNPSVSPALDAIVERALSIDRAARWPSAKTMHDALAEVRASAGHLGPPSLPKAVKISSLPPPSIDRTPGAITSTLMQSDPPPGPSNAPPARSSPATSETPKLAGQATTAPSRTSRSMVVPIAIAAGAIGALLVVIRARETPTTPTTPPASAEPARTIETTATPPSPSPSSPPALGDAGHPPAASVSFPSASPPLSVPPSASPPSASPPSPSPSPSPVAAPVGPRCGAGEVLSNGHCCSRGLEWQNGRCERPIATSF